MKIQKIIKLLFVFCLFAGSYTLKSMNLHIACEQADCTAVKKLLSQQGVEVNKETCGRTPLCVACENGLVDIVRLFLQHKKIDVNKISCGYTPLYYLCGQSDIRIIEELLAFKGIDINRGTSSSLCYACYKNHASVVALLLRQPGIEVNKGDELGKTPLYIACESGNKGIVKLLLKKKDIDIVKGYEALLYNACKYGDVRIAKLLLGYKNKARFDECGFVYDDRHMEVVKLLLRKARFEARLLRQKVGSLLSVACENGQIDIVKLLLEKEKIDINKMHNEWASPLSCASLNNNVEIVRLLLAQDGIDIDSGEGFGKVPLFYRACERGHAEVVRLFFAHKDFGIESLNKCKDIHFVFDFVCKSGLIEPVKFLLAHKSIDVNETIKKGNKQVTPLYSACSGGHMEVVILLLQQKGIDENKGDSTPLFVACRNRHIKVIKLLLERVNIDVNKVNKCPGFAPPLHEACLKGYLEIVKLLLKHGNINVDAVSCSGSSPLVWACQGKRLEIIQLLLENGAKVKKRMYERQHDNLIRSYLFILFNFEKATNKLRFVLMQQKDLGESLKNLFDFLLRIVFVRAMRKFLKNEVTFEETLFYKLYKKEKIDFEDALGVSFNDGFVFNLLKKYQYSKKKVGGTSFYFDKDFFNSLFLSLDCKRSKMLYSFCKNENKLVRPDVTIFCM